MERPIAIAADHVDGRVTHAPHARSHHGALDAGIGARASAHAFAALIVFGVFGYSVAMVTGTLGDLPEAVRAQWAEALAILSGSLGAIAVTFHQLRRTAPTALRDRSHFGCAWFGTPDEIITQAFLIGGVIAFVQIVAMPAPGTIGFETATPPFAEWQLLPAMLLAFAVIAAAPVAEELLMRGLLFATLRTRFDTPTAVTVVTASFALLHFDKIVMYPPSLFGTLAVGGLAMTLRLRHASLAPAIALHCGHNVTVCVVAALG